jgi:molybdate transport system ATP-binding protein
MSSNDQSLPLLQIHALNIPELCIDEFVIRPSECWALLGRNGAGKHQFARLLLGELDGVGQAMEHRFRDIRILSFETQQALYEKELHDDDSEFMEGQDAGTTVRELLGFPGKLPSRLSFLGLAPLLERGYRQLSSGEARKVLLAQALIAEPDLLVLDEPFDSLDQTSLLNLCDFFHLLAAEASCCLLFLLNSLDEIHHWHTHVGVMDQGSLIATGTATAMKQDAALAALLSFDPASLPHWPDPLPVQESADLLVAIHQARVSYGDKEIFSGLNLQIRKGDHTLLTGANGCGKSTLLGLITGDHPQCYSNDVQLFGIKRGSGETIWELKRRMGIVSATLHRDHRVPGSALEIVLSGFHDSIGLYDPVSPSEVQHAKQWLQLTGMAGKSGTAFKQLSFGEQRLVLIARALVKQPPLLVLDEPTQGLDAVNRLRVMAFLEHLSSQQRTTIVMVSHRMDERLPLFRQHLHME